MQIDTVIFDMDGVICHTNPFHAQAFDHFFQKRGLSPGLEEYADHMYGKSNSYIFSHFLGRKIEGAELLELADCGHSPHKDQAGIVISEVCRFINQRADQ